MKDNDRQEILEAASKRLEYFPETGWLVWRMPGRRSDLNGRRAGTVSNTDGYRYLKINQKRVPAHKIAFFMSYGVIPEEIDHLNRDRDDNRIENLRKASRLQNSRNQSLQVREKSSKYKGVCWDKNRDKWQASTKVMGKRIYLGRYKDELDAAMAYNNYVSEVFGEYACLNELE